MVVASCELLEEETFSTSNSCCEQQVALQVVKLQAEAIAGGAVLYVISDEGFKIEGYTWLLLYFAPWNGQWRSMVDWRNPFCSFSCANMIFWVNTFSSQHLLRCSLSLRWFSWSSSLTQYLCRPGHEFTTTTPCALLKQSCNASTATTPVSYQSCGHLHCSYLCLHHITLQVWSTSQLVEVDTHGHDFVVNDGFWRLPGGGSEFEHCHHWLIWQHINVQKHLHLIYSFIYAYLYIIMRSLNKILLGSHLVALYSTL